jgi:cobalt-zinc-cadmium efflux system protein
MGQHHHQHQVHRQHDTDNERRVLWAMLLTGGFMFAEVIGGLLSGSLALLADAGHMLTDFVSLFLAWSGFRLSRRPSDPNRTYGYYRFEVLTAFVNGIALFAVVVWIFYEAFHRLLEPVAILGGMMLVMAVLGLGVNIVVFLLLHGGDRRNINIRSAAAHVLGDLLGSIAAVVAAVVILATAWTPIDPLLSLVVGLLILRSACIIVADSAHILLEGTPEDMDVAKLTADLQNNIAEVRDVHHVHVWSLTPQRSLMTLHVTVDNDSDQDVVLQKVNAFLGDHWRVEHATIQVERARCPDMVGKKARVC